VSAEKGQQPAGKGKGKGTMEATDKQDRTLRMTGSGESGRTQQTPDRTIVQTDGDQTIVVE
jgi:hypothetical protein